MGGQGRGVWLLALLSLAAASCSDRDRLNPVHGQVLYRDQPLAGALVSFHPADAADLKADPPVGLTKQDGTFSLSTGQLDGARTGKYVVTILCSEPVKSSSRGISTAPAETQDRLKGAYATADTSRIRVEIKPGLNQLEPFRLK
jgi:hypothetical protein